MVRWSFGHVKQLHRFAQVVAQCISVLVGLLKRQPDRTQRYIEPCPSRVDVITQPLHLGAGIVALVASAFAMGGILEVLGRHPVQSLVVEEPDLEETFLDLYAGAS